jgi:pilus assembly protein CpaC
MTQQSTIRNGRLALATATALAASLASMVIPTAQAQAQTVSHRATGDVSLSQGRGQLITLTEAISDVMVSNPAVADVQVRSPKQIYIYAKAKGESTIFATTSAGRVVYSTNVRVASNLNSVSEVLAAAMPEANIQATTMNGLILLTGTVASPEDTAEAERLVKAFVGEDMQVVSRLRTATPLQVNLQVKIAEVSRDVIKKIGINLLSKDTTGGFLFGVAQGRNFGSINPLDTSAFPKLDASSVFGLPAGSLSLPFNPSTGQFVTGGTSYDLKNLGLGSGSTNLGVAGKLLGVDIAGALDLAEADGLVTTLAQPNLTALSGETASFLAGGEIPIPISQSLGQVSIEYKQYGVSLAFTPTVLADGRISMRVRPEVSQLTSAGSVQINGFTVPGLTTRRAETTVELGSGQSFMIGGLLQNTHNNSIDKAPGLGDLPILGSLFRSNSFRRNETELVIVITPYLVKPVSANQIALPTDGYRAPTDAQRFLMGQTYNGKSNEGRPMPSMGNPQTVPAAPSIGAADPAAAPAKLSKKSRKTSDKTDVATAAPGFGN